MTINLNPNINFKSTIPNNNNNSANNSSGFISKTVDTVADARKLKINVEEYSSGAAKGVIGGLAAGSIVMAANWAIRRFANKGVEGQSWFKTPVATVADITKTISTKIFNFVKNNASAIAYPFYEGPKQIFNYVKEAQGVGNAGKAIAAAVGFGVLALSLIKAQLKINQKTADVDHAYNTGHRDK